jgi:PPOX class probable F420-dependent enzyme
MEQTDALDRLGAARVGRFASLTPDGRPHIVAVTFAIVDGALVHMVDHKPKTTSHLQRLRNIEGSPWASLLVDHYTDDWAGLWWIRVDGGATIETAGERWDKARSALAAKYDQYVERPPEGGAIFLAMDRVTHWEGS